MILCDTDEERKSALAELEPFMKAAVKDTLRVMDGKPVVFRLLDPPLHEFVPQGEDKKKELAKDLGITVKEVEKRGASLHEVNPMMGHRGVRLHGPSTAPSSPPPPNSRRKACTRTRRS